MSGKKIYIVDDEGDLAELLQMHLEDMGYHCQREVDSRTALEQLDTVRPDLLITDVQMPYVSGYALIEKMQQISPETPILVITGFAHENKTAAALPQVTTLQKPFNLSELVERVQSLLPIS